MDSSNNQKNALALSNTTEPLLYEKSNLLILGRYDMSKNAQKVLAYALSKVHDMRFTEEQSMLGIKVSFSKEEIYNYLVENSKTRGTLPSELKKIAVQLHGQTVFVQKEKDATGFHSFTFVKTADYENGVFEITFHEDMFPYLVNRNGNFTLLEANHVKIMASNYTIRLYEVCRSYKYLADRADNKGIYPVDFHFVELRLMLGMIDSEDEDVKKITEKYKKDYDKIGEEVEKLCQKKEVSIAALKQQLEQIDKKDIPDEEKEEQKSVLRSDIKKLQSVSKYRSAAEFQKSVLKVARKEMQELFLEGKVDICFDFETIRRYHSVVGFKLYVLTRDGYKRFMESKGVQITMDDIINHKPEKNTKQTKLTQKQMDDIIDQIDELVEEKLKVKDLRAIAEAAGYDLDKVEAAISYKNGYKSPIENVTGFLVRAIQGEFSSTTIKGKNSNDFNNFKQNTYDFDALEAEFESQLNESVGKNSKKK